jgi:NADPH2:quinone reductase
MPLRRHIWQRLATDLHPRHLDLIVTATVSLDDVPAVSEKILAGEHTGRTVVQI